MADELTVTAGLSYSNTGVSMNVTGTDKVTVAANFAIHSIYTVTVAGAALPLGSIASPGFIRIKNTDAVHFVMLGNAGDTPVIKIKAGEVQVFRLSTAITPFIYADTANVVVEYMLVSD